MFSVTELIARCPIRPQLVKIINGNKISESSVSKVLITWFADAQMRRFGIDDSQFLRRVFCHYKTVFPSMVFHYTDRTGAGPSYPYGNYFTGKTTL